MSEFLYMVLQEHKKWGCLDTVGVTCVCITALALAVGDWNLIGRAIVSGVFVAVPLGITTCWARRKKQGLFSLLAISIFVAGGVLAKDSSREADGLYSLSIPGVYFVTAWGLGWLVTRAALWVMPRKKTDSGASA